MYGNFAAVSFYITTSNEWGFQFLYIIFNMFYCLFNCSIEPFKINKQVWIEVYDIFPMLISSVLGLMVLHLEGICYTFFNEWKK